LTPDFCAMSFSDTSIEERSIISSLAATRSLSAVVFFPPASLADTLLFNWDLMCGLSGECGAQISRCRRCTQELID
jgi:hypothetical protein